VHDTGRVDGAAAQRDPARALQRVDVQRRDARPGRVAVVGLRVDGVVRRPR
jgi:hypothetical protein